MAGKKKVPRTDIEVHTVTINAGEPVGPQVKHYRELLNLSTSIMEARTGIHYANISHIENNTGSYAGCNTIQLSHFAYLRALGVKQVVVKL